MKKFYLFTERGITERFFCGNIYEAMPRDEIRCCGVLMTFQECTANEFCREFDTRKEALDFSKGEVDAMEDSNNYARNAMRDEETFGMEGVDNCLNN